MDLTPEQTEELFTREVPDVQICLHEMRITPLRLDIDGGTVQGYVARMLGHGADNEPMTIDFVTVETILQEVITRVADAGMTAAIIGVMDALADEIEKGK